MVFGGATVAETKGACCVGWDGVAALGVVVVVMTGDRKDETRMSLERGVMGDGEPSKGR